QISVQIRSFVPPPRKHTPCNWTTVDYKSAVCDGGLCRKPLIQNGLVGSGLERGGSSEDLRLNRRVAGRSPRCLQSVCGGSSGSLIISAGSVTFSLATSRSKSV